jgi:hypothetical protein
VSRQQRKGGLWVLRRVLPGPAPRPSKSASSIFGGLEPFDFVGRFGRQNHADREAARYAASGALPGIGLPPIGGPQTTTIGDGSSHRCLRDAPRSRCRCRNGCGHGIARRAPLGLGPIPSHGSGRGASRIASKSAVGRCCYSPPWLVLKLAVHWGSWGHPVSSVNSGRPTARSF